MRFVYVIPTGSFLLGLALIGLFSDLGDYEPEPEEVALYTSENYQDKAKAYADRGDRQKALDTCAAMGSERGYSESAQELCLLGAYKALGDIDGQIETYEKRLARELADGDSGALTRSVIEGLKEKRDKKK